MKEIQLSTIEINTDNVKELEIIKTHFFLGIEDKKIISFLPTRWRKDVPILTIQLAKSLARGQRKVLLVNVDTANQSLFSSMDGRAGSGLFSVLTGETDLEYCICPTDIDGLSLLPLGEKPRFASELLSGTRFRETLNELKRQYDMVLLLLPAIDESYDGIEAAVQTDGSIVIISRDTSFKSIRIAIEMLRKRANLIGSILVKSAYPWKHFFLHKSK